MANDVFAQIASNGIGGRQWLLEEKTPAPHTTKECLLTTHTTGEYPAPEKPYTKEALYADLNCLREKMKPFLADLAPVQETHSQPAGCLRVTGMGMPLRPERYAPVIERSQAMISCAVPCAISSPPCSPAPGPMSTI